MKNKLLIGVLPLLVAGMMSGCAKQEAQIDENGEEIIIVNKDSSEGLVYEYNRTKDEYMVTNYIGNATGVLIPETYNGKRVTRIDDYAFRNNLVMKKVVLSKNISEIGEYAFSRTYNLDTIEIAKGNDYFTYEDGLVYNKAKTTIYFGQAHKYEHLVVPESVTSLRPGCFGNFENLTFIDLNISQITPTASSLRYIFASLFNAEGSETQKYSVDKMKNCYVPNIQTVHLTTTLDTFPSNFFYNCKTLTHVMIDSTTIKGFGYSAFSGCVSLRHLEYEGFADKFTYINDYCFSRCISLPALYIGGSFNHTAYSSDRNILNAANKDMTVYFSKYVSGYTQNWCAYESGRYVHYTTEKNYADYLAHKGPIVKIDLSQYDDYAPTPTV